MFSLQSQGPVSDVYRVEVNSEYFKVPECLVMPSPLDPKSKCIPQGTRVPKGNYSFKEESKVKMEFIYSEVSTLPEITCQ